MTEPTLAEARKRLEYVLKNYGPGHAIFQFNDIRTILSALDRAAEALGPFARIAKELPSSDFAKSWLFDMYRRAVISAEQVDRAATVHAELTQEGGDDR